MDKEELKGYLEKGTEIAGGIVGGAIGLIGGPAGALLGGGLGAAITIGVKEIISRQLSHKQNARTSASVAYIFTGIQEQLESGKQIRSDDFFNNDNRRSSAEELFEGVLIKCKDEYQEKKIKFISRIFESTIFNPDISPESANQILASAENFTYRKLCIISFYGQKDKIFDVSLLMNDTYSWYPNVEFSLEIEMLKQDIYELVNLGIIDTDNLMMTSSNDVIPNRFKLTKIGLNLFEIMKLSEISKDELIPIYESLLYKEEYGVSSQGTRNGKR